jgi:hypothetical protein
MIRFETGGMRHLLDGKPRVHLQELREVTFMIGRKVNDDDEGETAVLGNMIEEGLERRESPGRCSDSNDGRSWLRRRRQIHRSHRSS